MFRIFCVCLICLTSYHIQAQEIKGKIKDAVAMPLRSATIHFLNTGITVISDKEGNFTINKILPGKYVIEISAIGYATLAREIEIRKNNNEPLIFVLQNSLIQLDAV